MHETTTLAIILYTLCGASIGGFVIYLQSKIAATYKTIRAKIYNKKEQPPIEWD